jgi:signal recognition particle receptor subunit beta
VAWDGSRILAAQGKQQQEASNAVPHFNHARRELLLKVVYYGPGLGGKTTNLELIHRRTRAEMRGKLISLQDGGERTLFFDLLPLELGNYRGYTVRMHLCTVPGQIAADSIRRLVLRNVDGIVMVVDSQLARLPENLRSLRDLEQNLRLQGDDPSVLPTVVQYNKRDLSSIAPVDELARVLGVPPGVPQLEAVASAGIGVFDTLKAITRACLEVLPEPTQAPSGRVPSILPGRHASMFPDAEPEALIVQRVPRPSRTPP